MKPNGEKEADSNAEVVESGAKTGISKAETLSGYCVLAPEHPWHGPYHDLEYGFPTSDDRVLFERLTLEIAQAGLSWLTVLKKRAAFRAAFDQFAIDRVAAYGEDERQRLLADPGIIRNRLKIDAIIENARRLQIIRSESGSFAQWLTDAQWLAEGQWLTEGQHTPHKQRIDRRVGNSGVGSRRLRERSEWVTLFRRHFRFVGGEIVGEFLMSVGLLPGAHCSQCPVFERIKAASPPWLAAQRHREAVCAVDQDAQTK
ncbi:DNA-3-methyladenine glycosylase I [Azospirillaceae bacterium]